MSELIRNDDDKLIDLPPHQWVSEREKPHEPFFGNGWQAALSYAAGYAAIAMVVYLLR